MTNTLALILGAVILTAIAVDYMAYDLANSLFLGRKLVEFIDWLAFWR